MVCVLVCVYALLLKKEAIHTFVFPRSCGGSGSAGVRVAAAAAAVAEEEIAGGVSPSVNRSAARRKMEAHSPIPNTLGGVFKEKRRAQPIVGRINSYRTSTVAGRLWCCYMVASLPWCLGATCGGRAGVATLPAANLAAEGYRRCRTRGRRYAVPQIS